MDSLLIIEFGFLIHLDQFHYLPFFALCYFSKINAGDQVFAHRYHRLLGHIGCSGTYDACSIHNPYYNGLVADANNLDPEFI